MSNVITQRVSTRVLATALFAVAAFLFISTAQVQAVEQPAAILTLDIPAETKITASALIDSTDGKANNNADVEAVIASGLEPIKAWLKNTGTDASVPVHGAAIATSEHIQLWVNVNDIWWDINALSQIDAIYGHDIPVPPSFNEYIEIYPVSNVVGKYIYPIQIVQADDESVVLASTTATVIVEPQRITNIDELNLAIENQKDGQHWVIEAGDYGLDRFDEVIEGQPGWYFPVTANNITIEGEGNPVIYGNEFSLNGALSSQNLVTVFGDNVTLRGLTLMPKAEGNKTILVSGEDVTIEDVTITPNTKVDPSVYDGIIDEADRAFSKEWGGSLYFFNEGNHTVKNVTINNGGVSFRYAPSDTHITFENVNIVNYTNNADINGYRYSSGFNNSDTSITGAPIVTYKVDSTINNLVPALTAAIDGDIVSMQSDITTVNAVKLSKAITLNGNGHTLFPNFEKTDNSNNSGLLITADNVNIHDLTIDGTNGIKLHGVHVYLADNVTFDKVTLKNNKNAGMVVNGSTVTVTGITTMGNGWGGINVDQGTGVTEVTTLTVNGTSAHTETPALWRDDNLKTDVTIVDTNSQYNSSTYIHDVNIEGTMYVLKPAPSNGGGGGGRKSMHDQDDEDEEVVEEDEDGEVLGAATSTDETTGTTTPVVYYSFLVDFGMGTENADVTNLQTILINGGYLDIDAPTGYFGPLTFAAVQLYQGANGISNTGFVGPLTRAKLNTTPVSTVADQIAAILAQIAALQAQLDAMNAE